MMELNSIDFIIVLLTFNQLSFNPTDFLRDFRDLSLGAGRGGSTWIKEGLQVGCGRWESKPVQFCTGKTPSTIINHHSLFLHSTCYVT
jgi:hypothetical protein